MILQLSGKKYETSELIRKRINLKKQFREKRNTFIQKSILMLSGSTIGELVGQLELFCLSHGISPNITQGDYGRYYEEALFGNEKFDTIHFDFVYVHISNKNILYLPEPFENSASVQDKLSKEKERLRLVLESLEKRFACPVIINNYDNFPYRVMGNREAWDRSGRIRFIARLNEYLYEYAENHNNIYIQDLNYLSSLYGLKEWAQYSVWYKYKYAMAIDAIPLVAQNLSAIISSLSGLGKKCIAIDLDGTLWGGVIGDDGKDGVEIGNDTPNGEAYAEFQKYLSNCRKTGLLLSVISKNEENTAKSGFDREEMVLKLEDIAYFKANWDTKSSNLQNMAKEMNLGLDAYVFIDDNPIERDEVRTNLPCVEVPELSFVSKYIQEIEEAHILECTFHSDEDSKRTEYYIQNKKREEALSNFQDYDAYLESLKMDWVFKDFEEAAMERIVQLINKTNQFNLTTKRMDLEEVKSKMNDPSYLCIQGSMKDRFGDNGIITLFIGKVENACLNIELWLMSCRVFKRNIEYKLFDYILDRCKKHNIRKITGIYIPSEKNVIVKSFYAALGFHLTLTDENGLSKWEYELSEDISEI